MGDVMRPKGVLLSELIELLESHKAQFGDIPTHLLLHGSIYPLRPDNVGIEVIEVGFDERIDWDMYILLTD